MAAGRGELGSPKMHFTHKPGGSPAREISREFSFCGKGIKKRNRSGGGAGESGGGRVSGGGISWLWWPIKGDFFGAPARVVGFGSALIVFQVVEVVVLVGF